MTARTPIQTTPGVSSLAQRRGAIPLLTYTAGYTAGYAAGYTAGYTAGQTAGYATGFAAGVASVPLPNAVAPTITGVSPTAGAAPGAGGFPVGRAAALTTPIVLTINDVAPGLAYVCVAVRTYDGGDAQPREIVYRAGAFQDPFLSASTQVTVGHALTLTVRRDAGWTGTYLGITVDAIDGAGNIASSELIYTLPVDVEQAVIVDDASGTIDHVAAGLARLAQQFK